MLILTGDSAFNRAKNRGLYSPTWKAEPNLPNNWTAPVDYSAGDLYIEWEIIEAPKDAEDLVLQIGWNVPIDDERPFDLVRFKYMHLFGSGWEKPFFIQGKSYSTFHKMQNDRSFWALPTLDYSKGISGLRAFVRNTDWKVVGPSSPVRIKITMTLVAPGDTYQPPSRFGGIGTREVPALPKVQEALRSRQPGLALALAEARSDADGEAGQQAQEAIKGLNGWLDGRLQSLQAAFPGDPVGTYSQLQELHTSLNGSQRADDVDTLLANYKADPLLKAQIPAHKMLLKLEQAIAQVRQQVGKADFSDPEIQRKHARKLSLIVRGWQQLQRKYPDSVSVKNAHALLVGIGLTPPE